jgi:hypothetical protein
MNRTFKTVWSNSSNSFIAVSEACKTRCKASPAQTIKTAVIAALSGASLLQGGLAFAEQIDNLDAALNPNPVGTTISHTDEYTIKFNDGGVYTIDNFGTIELIGSGSANYTIWISDDDDTTLTTLTNNSGATISASETVGHGSTVAAIYFQKGQVTSLVNSGSISTTSSVGISVAYLNGIYNQATIGTLNNALGGTISVSGRGSSENTGIYNTGTINSLINFGSITVNQLTGGSLNAAIYNSGTITSLTNSGTISTTVTGTSVSFASAIYSSNSTINTLNNNGTISTTVTGTGSGTASAAAIYSRISTINTLNNNGTISSTVTATAGSGTAIGYYLYHNTGLSGSGTVTNTSTGTISATTTLTGTASGGTAWGINNNRRRITDLTNAGTISASVSGAGASVSSANALGIRNYFGEITTLTNTGTISATTTVTGSGEISANGWGIYNYGSNATIGTITNTEIISGSSVGIYNTASATIGTITNTGIISGDISIYNQRTPGANEVIGTLNNLQSDLTYKGFLPTNYNIIIRGDANYGQTTFSSSSGTTTFGIDLTNSGADIGDQTYEDVLKGDFAEIDLLNGTSGVIEGATWALSFDGANWDLTINGALSGLYVPAGPSAADTQTSIQAIKGQLQGNLNSLTAGANFANMNTYDCNFFDSKGGCFSFGNRYTDVQSPSIQTNSFVATGGYKLNDHFRVAGFIDQNLNYNMASNIDIENKGPLMGLIGVWNQNANQLGWQIKLANAYQSKDARITRSVTGSSEAGRGQTDIDSQSYVAELSYNHAVSSSLLLQPYAALRYAVVEQDGYTETGVANPLTFNTIRDRSKTSLVGVKFKKQLTDKVVARGSVGLEHDLSHKTDNLLASGVSGLTTESFSNQLDKTRPVASLGADYYIDPTQRLSVNAFYQELPFASTKARTLYLNYMLAF